MKGREAKGAPAADLLVCFPSRAHLSLMPKPICSPARSSEPNKRHLPHHHLHRLKKSSTRGSTGQASPMLWAKTKSMGSAELVGSEPTSPKVTCAGQIKVRHKAAGACKSWQSVMEEIERMHNSRKQRRKPHWAEALGFKEEVMQFLTCLRSIRLDFRCFGSFHNAVTTDDDEDEDLDDENDDPRSKEEDSRTMFSKWFMVLQEEQRHDVSKRDQISHEEGIVSTGGDATAVPPPNALLLMRCRSAPAKSWLEEREEECKEANQENDREEEEEEERETELGERRISKRSSLKCLMEDETRKMNREEGVLLMRYDPDFHKISSDIAKETWVVGGIRDPLSRSRSWKR